MKDPFVIGISGSIGSGKSLVRHLLALRGVLPVDADELTHFLLVEEKAGYREVVHAFGSDILNGSGELDREKLGRMVFGDPRKLQNLEAILHPLVHRIMLDVIAGSPSPVIAVEAIKLYTSQLLSLCDSRWFVTTILNSQLDRLKKKRRMDADTAMQRLRQQYFPEDVHMDYFIENSGSIAETWEQLDGIWQDMRSKNSRFRTVLDRSAKKTHRLMLDYPAIQWVDHPELQSLMEWAACDSLQNPVSWEDEIFSGHYFINRMPSFPLKYFLWKFDHFNAVVSMDATGLDGSEIIAGLREIEMIACSWLGNSVILHIRNGSSNLWEKLRAAGYQKYNAVLLSKYPFLKPAPLKEGTIDTPWVKLFTNGIWRFIP